MEPEWGTSILIIAEDFHSVINISYYTNEDEAYLGTLHVDKEFRNSGRGKEIFEYAIAWCKEHEFRSVYLWCYKTSWVCKWYKRIGFHEDNERDNETIWMSMDIK